MALYLVTYELNRPGMFHPALFKRIETAGNAWHAMNATWFVQTALSASQLAGRIKEALDANDKLVVCKVTPDAAWAALKYGESEWLKSGMADEPRETEPELDVALAAE